MFVRTCVLLASLTALGGGCFTDTDINELCPPSDPGCEWFDYDGDGVANADDPWPEDGRCGAYSDDNCTACGVGCEAAQTCVGAEGCACVNPRTVFPACTTCQPLFAGEDCAGCADPHYKAPECTSCLPAFTGESCEACTDPLRAPPECDSCLDVRFVGQACDQCAPDRYPAGVCDVQCVAEVTCNGQGTCDAAGACECDVCFTGPSCADTWPETCNGLDDDCDGQTDEGFGQTTCGEGACAHTVDNCSGGEMQICDPMEGASDEMCNGLDDDCDGLTDEELGQTTCGLSACAHTIDNCLGGVHQVCDPLEGATDEVCNGLDDDCGGTIDEDFTDASGHWTLSTHCGGCGVDCTGQFSGGTGVCGGPDDEPACVVGACDPGYLQVSEVACMPTNLSCQPCVDDGECSGGTCVELDGQSGCVIPCDADPSLCPDGYSCVAVSEAMELCLPMTGSCSCTAENAGQMRTCSIANALGTCSGVETCDANYGWSDCTAAIPESEMCDGVDNDCNGLIDDGLGQGDLCVIEIEGGGACQGTSVCLGSEGWVCEAAMAAVETCNGLDDDCDGTMDEAVDCDDGEVCTIDTCDSALGCVAFPVVCDDDDACTTDACADGACTHEAIDCSATKQVCEDGACVDPLPTAVIILDAWHEQCSPYSSPGADIDAVELLSCTGAEGAEECVSLGFLVAATAEPGTDGCPNEYTDPQSVIGEVDYASGGYIALAGGWVAGEFSSDNPITTGLVVRVHEHGSVYGGGDDPYEVYVMTDLACLETEDPESCTTYLGSGFGLTDFVVP